MTPGKVGVRETTERDVQMSETSYEQPTGYDSGYDQRTGWTGWIIFAGVMMILGGSLNLFYGIVAAVNDEWVVFTNRGDVYLDVSEWGWVHIILGAIVLLSGIGVFSGNILARTVGVIVAANIPDLTQLPRFREYSARIAPRSL